MVSGLRRPTVWLVAALLLLAIFGAPIVWLVAARIAGVPLVSARDPNALIGTIGGIMGTIFVVGGLVIALASLVTLLSIQEQVERRFEALLPGLQQRADRQIEGYIAFTEAGREPDWRRAEELSIAALDSYPELRGARSALGLRLAREVAAYFKEEHAYRDLTDIALPWRSASRSLRIAPPVTEAIMWLSEALKYGEGGHGETQAALALMYGVQGRFDKMTSALGHALGTEPDLKDYLVASDQLIMLVHACASRDQLQQLGRLLGTELPVATQAVVASIEAVDPTSGTAYVDWFVAPQPAAWAGADTSRFPELIRFLVTVGANGVKTALASRLTGGRAHEVVPADQQYIAITALVAELERRYLFLCQAGNREV